MAKGFGGRGGAGGGGGFGQMQNLMKQASQMQAKLQQAQEEAEAKTYDLEGSGGAVRISMNGKLEILSIKIEPDLLSDVETLQDALQVAINDAIAKVTEETKKITESAGAGFKLPPGLF